MKTSDSDRIIEGYGTVEIVDNQGDFVPVSKIAEIMPIYMERGGVLMDTHTNRHVGRLLDWKLADNNGKPAMWLKAQIFNDFSIDNMIWDAVKEGHYTGFSFGGRSLDKEVVCDGAMCHNRINNLEMWEWSIVPKPANKLSTIKHFSEDKIAKGGSFLAKGLIPELSSEGDIVYRMIDVAMGGDVLNKACSCEEDEKAHLEPMDHIDECPLKRRQEMEEEKAYGYHGRDSDVDAEFTRPSQSRPRDSRHDIGADNRRNAREMGRDDPGDSGVRGALEDEAGRGIKARKTGERYDRLSEREKSDMEYEEEKAANPRHGYHGRDSKAERDLMHDEESRYIPKVPPRDHDMYGDLSSLKSPAKSRADTAYHHEMKDTARWNQSDETTNYKNPGPRSKNMEKSDMNEEEKGSSPFGRHGSQPERRQSNAVDNFGAQPRNSRHSEGNKFRNDEAKFRNEQEKSDMDYYEKEDTPVSPPSSGSDAPMNKILSKLEAMEARLTKLEGGEKKEGQAFSQMAEEHKGEEAEKAETPKTVKTPLPDQYGAGPSSTDDHQMGSDKKISGLNKTNDPAAIVREELKKMGFNETPRPRHTGQSVDMTGNGPITVSGMLAKAAESGVATALSGQGNNIHSTLSRLSFKDLHQILE